MGCMSDSRSLHPVLVLVCGVFGVLQADAGAQVVQIFDSWASHLSPQDFDVFSGPYIKKVRGRSRKQQQEHNMPAVSCC